MENKNEKKRKRKTKPKFKVIYEYIPSPDAEERLNRAYDMLFDKIVAEEQVKKEKLSR